LPLAATVNLVAGLLRQFAPLTRRRRSNFAAAAHFAMGARSLTGAERAPRAIVAAVGRQSDTIIPLLNRVVDAYVADAERRQTQLIWEEAGGLCTLALLLAMEVCDQPTHRVQEGRRHLADVGMSRWVRGTRPDL